MFCLFVSLCWAVVSPHTWSSIWHAVKLCCVAVGANWMCFSQLPVSGLLASTQNLTWPDPSRICSRKKKKKEMQISIGIRPGYCVQTQPNHKPPTEKYSSNVSRAIFGATQTHTTDRHTEKKHTCKLKSFMKKNAPNKENSKLLGIGFIRPKGAFT